LVEKQTYSERRWPDTPEFNAVLHRWRADGSIILLRLVWKGYDSFCAECLTQVDCSEDDGDLERDITQLLEPKIREGMTGFEPFDVQHGPYERESWLGSSAQPPLYDIAFSLRSNPRVMWPLEAKVLRTDGSVAEYIKEIKSNFLTCRYAPFSSEAAMLGYLLEGDSGVAFSNIGNKGNWKLNTHPQFPDRDHRTSDHKRKIPEGKDYPANFRCHHLLFNIKVL
jgi:hypothetical protein